MRLPVIWKRRRRNAPACPPWDLSAPLLHWAPGVAWTIGDACQGTQVFGATGAGKSTGSMAAICKAFLRAGFGGLFLTAKREDAATYTRYVQDAGRMDDLLRFSPESDLRFNFIESERARRDRAAGAGGGVPSGMVENLTSLLMTATELTERGGARAASGDGGERYFRLEAARLARNGLLALALPDDRITIPDLHRLITSAPLSLDEARSAGWQERSFCFRCLQAADRAPKPEPTRADFELALSYFLCEWPGLSSRTRSVVQSTLTSATDLLSRGLARDMLSAPNPNLRPEMTHEGRVVIADFPALVHHDMGRLIQVILKLCFQRAHSRRDVTANPRPTFIVADESHLLVVDADQTFQTTARGTRTAVVYATQSISTYLDAFGPHGEAKVQTLLGNLQTQIFHQQTDTRTIHYVQELVGRSRQFFMNGNAARDADWMSAMGLPRPAGPGGGGGSSGFSESMEHEIQARDLNGLAKGGPPAWLTEAILYQGGRTFGNGKTWLPVTFRQQRG